jgi:hypothetical protein
MSKLVALGKSKRRKGCVKSEESLLWIGVEGRKLLILHTVRTHRGGESKNKRGKEGVVIWARVVQPREPPGYKLRRRLSTQVEVISHEQRASQVLQSSASRGTHKRGSPVINNLPIF